MTRAEKITLAEKQVKEAETLITVSRRQVEEWEALLDLRIETLERLKKS